MIGQYLPQTNESATVPKTFQFSELNKAHAARMCIFHPNSPCDLGNETILRCMHRIDVSMDRFGAFGPAQWNGYQATKPAGLCFTVH
jgi:hypothetical protein